MQLIKQVPNKSIDCIYTDVPYLYKMGGGGSSPVAKRIRAMADGLDNANISSGFDYSIFEDFVRVMKKINCFIWCSKLQIFDIANWFLDYGRSVGKEIFYEILVWCKTNPTPATNNTWLPDVEYCLYFRESGVRLLDGYEHKHKWYMSGLNVIDKDNYNHPTIKPMECVVNHLKHVCMPNSGSAYVVLDPFVGSGTTCAAAKEIGVDWIGFEIDPTFYDIARTRLSGVNQKGEVDLFSFGQEETHSNLLDLCDDNE